ncbi:MAG: type II secretion system protein [Thermodesulfobacteriota bacterium]
MNSIRRKREAGFTLIELGVVLVIAGIMLTLGYYSWGMVVEGRKNAATLAELRKVRACIMASITADNVYPSWTATRTAPINPTNAVDRCLEDRVDSHTNPIYFIEGVRSTAQRVAGNPSLAGGCLLPSTSLASTDPCSSSYSTSPPGPPPIVPQPGTAAGSSSYTTDRDGVVITDVAFILASFGRSGVADNVNLQNMFLPAGTLSASILATGINPSFARAASDGTDPLTDPAQIGNWSNDIYLIVTYQEILGELAKARGLTGKSGL